MGDKIIRVSAESERFIREYAKKHEVGVGEGADKLIAMSKGRLAALAKDRAKNRAKRTKRAKAGKTTKPRGKRGKSKGKAHAGAEPARGVTLPESSDDGRPREEEE